MGSQWKNQNMDLQHLGLSSCYKPKQIFFILLMIFAYGFCISIKSVIAQEKRKNASVPAFLVFGDSSADTGNNNYIPTMFRSNFPPYGRDFKDHLPSGRFTNGKIGADFLASYLGLKETIPPYLEPFLSDHELLTGVNFASAGSGFDQLTSTVGNVIPMTDQLKYMEEYIKKLERIVGRGKAASIIRESMVLVAAGTNDFIINYYALPIRRFEYSEEEYQDFILDQLKQFLQALYRIGVRKFVVNAISPMGDLPVEVAVCAMWGNCNEKLNSAALSYNNKLQALLNDLADTSMSCAKIAYADIYNTMLNLTMNPSQYGFEVTRRGCCGITGYFEAGPACNPFSPVCPDASKYMYWDSVHPTEKAYKAFADTIYKSMVTILYTDRDIYC